MLSVRKRSGIRKGAALDYLELYYAIEEVRNNIYRFNIEYRRTEIETDLSNLLSSIQKICEKKCADIPERYNLNETSNILQNNMNIMKRAVYARDYVSIYDIVNGDIIKSITALSKNLFEKKAEELCDYFWKKNRDALNERYPKILDLLEEIKEGDNGIYVRPYGQKGRVVYRQSANEEVDVFSEYQPFETEYNLSEIYGGFEDCSRIYLWGCNGGFEIDYILHKCNREGQIIRIYVTDLSEFKFIMKNMPRAMNLRRPEIIWNFNVELSDFFRDVLLEEKDETYLYVSRYYNGNKKEIEKFALEHSVKNNMRDQPGSFAGYHFAIA